MRTGGPSPPVGTRQACFVAPANRSVVTPTPPADEGRDEHGTTARSRLSRRRLLQTGSVGAAASAAIWAAPSILTVDAAAACTVGTSDLASARVAGFTGNPPDILRTTNNGTSFTQVPGVPSGGQMTPYSIGTNGTPGVFGVAGDLGMVYLFDGTTWHVSDIGSPIITGLAGNGAHWIAIATNGEWWWTNNWGVNWNYANYVNYASFLSTLSVYDLEYANGAWVACGYDSLQIGRTFWRANVSTPTSGASGFSGGSGQFTEIQGSGTGNLVTVYGIRAAQPGNCATFANLWVGAGNFGTVWRSTNNGASWFLWNTTNGAAINEAADYDPDTDTVMVASNFGIYRYIAGVNQSAGLPGGIFYDIAFVGARTWVAVGDSGKIYVTKNNGTSWSAATVPHGAAIYSEVARVP